LWTDELRAELFERQLPELGRVGVALLARSGRFSALISGPPG
jgi:hypothetical protein